MTDSTDSNTAPNVVVLRQKIHGMDVNDYVEEIRSRLPGYEVELADTPQRERELLPSADVVTGLDLPSDGFDRAENLSLFACVYAGTGHLDIDEFVSHDVAVTNASGVHATNIAEYVLGGVIAFNQGFLRAVDRKERREWRSWQTRELTGSKAVVVGLGAIGSEIVERFQAFGVETVGVRYSPSKGGPTDEIYGFDEIHEAVAGAEYVVLACPLTDETEGLVDASVLGVMPPDALLVNIARGPVVETDALLDSLRWNQLRGAVLDVTDPEPLPAEHELWGFENVLITPHNAGHTPEYFARCAEILAENVERLADGESEYVNQVV